MIDRKDVAIVIPHLGGTSESEYAFEQCITSINETEPDIERIAIRNGEKCDVHRSRVKIIEQGQCRAVNAGVQTTNKEWLLISNDDMIYPPGWFDKLTWVVEKNGKYEKCISSQLVEPRSGAPTFEVFNCGGAGGDFDKQKFLIYLENYQRVEMLRNGFNLPFIIKRELWDLVGGYDINYDPWSSNSDSDLLYKIKLAGVQPKQNTECKIYHFSQTSGTFESQNQSYWHKNFKYFEDKWGFPRTDEGIWTADFDMPEKKRIYHPWWENHFEAK